MGDLSSNTFEVSGNTPRVVGASSAFPGFFPPVEISAEDLGVREGQFPTESFTDGGVYDNLGTRAFSWLEDEVGTFDRVLVSDAGKPFQILGDQSLGLLGNQYAHQTFFGTECGSFLNEKILASTQVFHSCLSLTLSHEMKTQQHSILLFRQRCSRSEQTSIGFQIMK